MMRTDKRYDDVTDLLDKHGDGTPVDTPVMVGACDRVPARLVGVRAPQQVVEQRRKRLRETERNKGRTPSARQLAMGGWSLFITNVPPDQLSVLGEGPDRPRWSDAGADRGEFHDHRVSH